MFQEKYFRKRTSLRGMHWGPQMFPNSTCVFTCGFFHRMEELMWYIAFLKIDLGIPLQPYVSILVSTSYYNIIFPPLGSTNILASSGQDRFYMTNKIFFTHFQYNHTKDIISTHACKWRYKPHSDLFLYIQIYLPHIFSVRNPRGVLKKLRLWRTVKNIGNCN